MPNSTIPIVLASDENYAPYMYVTILSILENKKKSTVYEVYILVDKYFSENLLSKFNKLAKKYNTEFHYIIMGEKFISVKMLMNHITTPTYYRLCMPELLENYSKAIYLDTDVIVQKDLSEFYNIDISEYYIAGVNAAAYIFNYDKEYYDSIGLKNINKYINAGVTLWNLDKIRNTTGKQEELYELALKGFSSQDQDVINLAFQDNVKILSPKYNLMTKYSDLMEQSNRIFSKYENIWTKEQIIDALLDPIIIHYAAPAKPWNKKIWLDDYWWQYAKKSPFHFWFRKNIFSISKNSKHIIINVFSIKIRFKYKK